ncbi:M20/M25/M40 family metallo-hydrolase [Streptomyces sp. NPDC056161]|uniref:M20/M25/M40 family metallo-hydrolase n=1 Tax=Streptomyces sp. NPDC056161 TaxID=3345732 RepID=UPI0035D5B9F1
MTTVTDAISRAQDEAVAFTQDLVRIDTTNLGDGHSRGEPEAAEYVAERLREVGLTPTVLESRPGHANVVVRIPGADRTRGGLVVHGHLDVVPADPDEWSVDPFCGDIIDGVLWGRGSIDMKGTDGAVLAAVRHLVREGRTPPRDLVVAFFADEEDGGTFGAQWLVSHHPELFDGCDQAVTEGGGFSIDLATGPDRHQRAYVLRSAEKGMCWIRLRATGKPGHGSFPHPDSAVVRLLAALTRIAGHHWPVRHLASVQAMIDGIGSLTGHPLHTLSAEEQEARLREVLGQSYGRVAGARSDSVNITRLNAGYKTNVVPGLAEAVLDCRILPGHEDEVVGTIRELAGDRVEVTIEKQTPALESPLDVPLVHAMRSAVRAEDPDARFLPFCSSSATDNKALSRLGIQGYGFAPMRLPADLSFSSLFHGIDERVPVASLRFGTRVLIHFLDQC